LSQRVEEMRFPEKYIKNGRFKLHSGDLSNIFYDVNELLTDWDHLHGVITRYIDNFRCTKRYFDTHVGIATGGAIIASSFIPYAMIKDDELKGKCEGRYCLIDDVVTTETSIRKAIDMIGYDPEVIIVCIDRRKKKKLDIVSIYNIEENWIE